MRTRIALLLGLLWMTGCDEPEAEPKPLIRPVRYVEVQGERAARQRTFSGTILAGNRTRMSFQVPGRIRTVAVSVGDHLRKGQLVAKLDPIDFELQLREAEASADQAEAQARSAMANYERVRALYENQNASRQDLDNARANRDTSLSAASAARQAVRRLQRQLQYATLTAPAPGTISEVNVEENEVVTAGQVVAVLQVGEQLEVAVEVPESTINQIERGDPATVDVTAVGLQVQGEVYEVGVPPSGSSVFPINVRLEPDPSKRVRAGMAAEVTFQVRSESKEGAPRLLPATAVGEDRQGRFVFVVEPTQNGLGVVHRTPVKLGNLVGEGIELLEGVEDGQLVVTAGVSRIRDGMTVKVPPKETGEDVLPDDSEADPATAQVAPESEEATAPPPAPPAPPRAKDAPAP